MKKMFKKIVLCMVALLALLFVACGKEGADEKKSEISKVEVPEGTGVQFAELEKGDPIATIEVEGYGKMVFRLFPEQAPKAVENFIGLAEKGYYDGITFHRVIDDFMIQGGDPTGTGSGGDSYFGTEFEDEFSMDLFPYRGSLCMANAGENTNGSQFFIVQTNQVSEDYVSQIEGLGATEVAANYKKIGGTPWLWYAHTVFGQIIDGMEVVDAIAAVEVNGSDKPTEDVMIKTITITYEE